MRSKVGCVAISVSLLLSTSACQTTGPLQPGDSGPYSRSSPAVQLTAAEQQMRTDKDRFDKTVIGGVMMGLAAGALLGALAAAAAGGKKKDIQRGALIGAAAGGVVGGIDGYVTAKKEQAGRNEVAALQATAADVRQDNGKLQAFLDSSATVLAEGKARLAALSGDLSAKRLTAAQADQARRREEQNIASMSATLAKAKSTRDEYTQASAKFQVRTPAERSSLDAEIANMNRRVSQLENNINEYNRALAVSKA